MDQKFSAQIRAGSHYTYLKLRGVIDEDNNLVALTSRVDAERVVLDLSEIDRINSYGVRDWVNWLSDLETKGRQVLMVRCSPAILAQANMVTNFIGDAVIMSFYAPYYCPSCDQSHQKLLSVEQFAGQSQIKAPEYMCEECGGAMEFDDFEESYFAFLESMDSARIDETMRRAAEEVAPDLEKKIRALNEGQISQLSGPLHTASLTADSNPGVVSGGYPGLIRKVSEVQRGELPEQVREAVGARAVTPAPFHVESVPKTSAPVQAPPPPGERGPSTARTLLFILLPYALIAVALFVVAVLIFFVLTIK